MLNGFLKIKTFGSGSPNNPIGEPRPFYILQNGVTVRLKGGYPPGTTGKADNDFSGKIYTAVSQSELEQLDKLTTDWSLICTTLCTSLEKLFFDISLNPKISHFDTVNVVSLYRTFAFNDIFNANIDYWDVSNVVTMFEMARECIENNQPYASWDVRTTQNMDGMFKDNISFNQDLSSWCVQQFPSEPDEFSVNTPLWVLPKPSWGVFCGGTTRPNKMTILSIVEQQSTTPPSQMTILTITN